MEGRNVCGGKERKRECDKSPGGRVGGVEGGRTSPTALVPSWGFSVPGRK